MPKVVRLQLRWQGAPAPVQTIGETVPLAATSQTILPQLDAPVIAPSMAAPGRGGRGFRAAERDPRPRAGLGGGTGLGSARGAFLVEGGGVLAMACAPPRPLAPAAASCTRQYMLVWSDLISTYARRFF
jgi:hypothetical protein